MARNDRSRRGPTRTAPGTTGPQPGDDTVRPAPEGTIDDPVPAEPVAVLPDTPASPAEAPKAGAQDAETRDASAEDAGTPAAAAPAPDHVTQVDADAADTAQKADLPPLDTQAPDARVADAQPASEPVPPVPVEANAPSEHAAPAGNVSEETAPASDAAQADRAPEAQPEPALITPPAPPARRGPSPWIALPLGAIAGAAVAAVVAYALVPRLARPADSGLAARVQALEARPKLDPEALGSLDTRLAKLEQAPVPDMKSALSALQAEIGTLRQAQQALQGANREDAAAATRQASALTARIDAVQQKMDQVAANAGALDKAVATLSVLGSLREAILAGRPFSAELESARALLGPQAGALAPLDANARTGFATSEQLAKNLAQAATSAVKAAEAAPAASGESSVVDRLLSSAGGLVRLRPAEAPADVGVAEQVAQAQVVLRAGNLDKTLELLGKLPPEARDKLAAVIADITVRRDAATLTNTLYQQALAAISGKVP